jgi:Fur family ferric uptake transcriptional regulator
MMGELADRLQQAGYKLTAPRRAVLQVLEAGEHLGPAEVLERGRAIYPTLSRATVYRTLELLTELGVIRPIYLGDAGPCFTSAEGGHQHLVCSDCGAVIEFDECGVSELEQTLAEQLGFEIQSHLLEFYGRCRTCRE